MTLYVVQHKTEPAFWSNTEGWVDLNSGTKFTSEERCTLNLPTEGTWITLWEANSIQFSRFITECKAHGVFSDEDKMEQVAESLDFDVWRLL
jgi:hypothetical protein